jgi:hypothetical protein
MIKVKERSEKDIMIRCTTKQEKQFVLGIFMEMKTQPRMDDKITVKDFRGYELKFKKQLISEPQQPQVLDETMKIVQEPTENVDNHVDTYSEKE